MDDEAIRQTLEDSNRIGIEFLLIDAQVAHTLLDSAEVTSVPENRLRRIAEAHKAYDSIVHLLKKLTPTPEQQEELDRNLLLIRERLASAGVKVT